MVSIRPYVEIIEQPASKSQRFRYLSEVDGARSVGSIPGVSSTSERRTYPAIRVHGYKGPFVVLLSLLNPDDNLVHPHSITGSDTRYTCKNGVIFVISNEPEVVFKNIGILCVKGKTEKDVTSALELRRRMEIDPFGAGFKHLEKHSLINFTAVRLCFQVFLPGPDWTQEKREDLNKYSRQLKPVASDIVYDAKKLNDLKIVYSPAFCGPLAGETELTLLCDKYTGHNPEVVFEDGRGWVQKAHVKMHHKQLAIVFYAPAYEEKRDPRSPDYLKVNVYLQQMTDRGTQRSQTIEMEYLPYPPPNYTSGIKKKGSMGRSFRRSPSELTHEQPVGVSQNADIKVSPPSYQEFASPIAEHKVNASNWQDKDLSAQGYHIMSYMNGHPIVNRSMTNNIALTSTARVNNVPPGQHRVIGFPQDIKIKRSASEHNDGTLDSGEQSLKRDKPLPPAFDSQYDRPSSSSYPNLNNPTAITNMPPPISVPVRAANSLLASIVSNPIVHNGVASNNSQEMMEIAADMCPEPSGKIPSSVTECYNQLMEDIEPSSLKHIRNENYTADNCHNVDNSIDQMIQSIATENTPSNNPINIPGVNYTISDYMQLDSSIDDVSEELKIMHVTNKLKN